MLTFQGNLAFTMQGPGDGVLQPTLSSSPPGDLDSLDAGIWADAGSQTWGGGPVAQDASFFPTFQYCQLLPGGYSTWNFTDSAPTASVASARAIAFLGHVYLFYLVEDTGAFVFLDHLLPTRPTNAIGTLADIPFTHPFDATFNTFAGVNALFTAALGAERATACYARQSDFNNNTFLYFYPELVQLSVPSGHTIINGVLPQSSPDFQSGINYTVSENSGYQLSQWTVAGAAIKVLSAATAVTYDAPLTARGGVIQMKPCAFGWLIRTGGLSMSGKNTTFLLASRDLTRYWSLILTPSSLSTGFDFNDSNFGLQIDPAGYFYQFSSSAHLFATATSQLSSLPLTPSLPNPDGPIPADGVPAGDGTDPQIVLQLSNDGGKTWGMERLASMGRIGDYQRLVKWSQNGRSNNRAVRVICSGPVDASLVAADLDAEPGT